jgi:hypothetical protein
MRHISFKPLALSAMACLGVIGSGPMSARIPLGANFNGAARIGQMAGRSPVDKGGLSQLVPSWGAGKSNLFDPSKLFFEAPTFPTGRSDYAIATGDFNGDGKLDLVTTDQDDNLVYILLGNGDGTFGPPVSFATSRSPSSVAVGDFNGDGKLDLAVAAEFPTMGVGSVSILLGNGDGTFQPPTRILRPEQAPYQSPLRISTTMESLISTRPTFTRITSACFWVWATGPSRLTRISTPCRELIPSLWAISMAMAIPTS